MAGIKNPNKSNTSINISKSKTPLIQSNSPLVSSKSKSKKHVDLNSASTSKTKRQSPVPTHNQTFSPLATVELDVILEEEQEEEDVTEDVDKQPVPRLKLSSEDVAGEISYWSSAVFCYILGAKPPSSVITGFVKRVWQSYGVHRIFLPNGIFLVRFKSKEKQMEVVRNGHLMFDSKPVIVKEWTPEVELIKHDVQLIPIWMKLYGLDIKFWGPGCLTKICGLVGKFLRCDEATANRAFLGYARLLVEVKIGQEFPTELIFEDEMGKTQKIKVVYDWLPLSCAKCKGLGHVTDQCRNEVKKVQKVWRPKVKHVAGVQLAQKPQTPIARPAAKPRTPETSMVTPVMEPIAPTVTPEIGQGKVVNEESLPRRFITRLLRHDSGDPRLFTPRGITFMDALNLSMHKARTESKKKLGFLTTNSENGYHQGGRVWLMWDPNLYQVDVLDITAQCIHSKVFDKMNKVYFWVTMVYGFNKLQERESLWERLKCYALQCDGSWVVCGDFNNIVSVDERIGGTEVTWAEMAPMRTMMSDCNLFEPKVKCSFYTWNNKHEADTKVYSRLDKSLAANYHIVVQTGWNIEVQGTPMFRIVKKLKGLKHKLKELDREQFSDIENLTHVTELSLKHFQEQVMSNPLNTDFCNAEKECAHELIQLKNARDSFLAQKAKEEWAKNGDDNTSFFHASIKRRRAYNRVYQIKDKDGVLCSKSHEIKHAFEEYYCGLLGSSKGVNPVHKGIVQSGKCLTAEHRSLLTQVVTDDEIKKVMFSIPGTKAPGPDGYSSQFFKDSWAIVGKDVCAAVRNMISTGNILKESNNTILTLLPKVDLPDTVMQFRPIACCNTVYKCMAKVVCSRLSSILPDIIHLSQSAFIAGRDIVGNILICQDLIKLYKRKNCSPRLMMNIDLQKAYDSIEWSYLNEMLRGDLESVTLLLRAFGTFSLASGLQMNKDKSNFYCNGVTESIVQAIENALDMRRATIPFKYLGVKIMPKRLGILELSVLDGQGN
ncbi:uncharacterized protein LOC141601863 [Silene latifolia]|uniref:uncharacterized protein LOC141601863 n=1 Tax=Silene latifolia TaxID=37657 RepID=UPI003D786EF4